MQEQIFIVETAAHGRPRLEQSVPERLQHMEKIHAGAEEKCEEEEAERNCYEEILCEPKHVRTWCHIPHKELSLPAVPVEKTDLWRVQGS